MSRVPPPLTALSPLELPDLPALDRNHSAFSLVSTNTDTSWLPTPTDDHDLTHALFSLNDKKKQQQAESSYHYPQLAPLVRTAAKPTRRKRPIIKPPVLRFQHKRILALRKEELAFAEDLRSGCSKSETLPQISWTRSGYTAAAYNCASKPRKLAAVPHAAVPYAMSDDEFSSIQADLHSPTPQRPAVASCSASATPQLPKPAPPRIAPKMSFRFFVWTVLALVAAFLVI